LAGKTIPIIGRIGQNADRTKRSAIGVRIRVLESASSWRPASLQPMLRVLAGALRAILVELKVWAARITIELVGVSCS
jgi:hypothetical protein